MKCSRVFKRVAIIVIFAGLFVPVARSEDTKPNPAVTPEARTETKWKQRNARLNRHVKEDTIDLLFVGDSITEGWESTGKEVWNKFYAKRNAGNIGISGDQTQHVLWRLDHGNADGISPKLAVLLIGTNNASHDQTPEQIVEGIKATIDKLRTKLPETKVLLLGIFPRGDDKHAHAVNMKINEQLGKLADGQCVVYMDINSKLAEPDGTVTKAIMPDLLHLSSRGYTIWAEAIEPTVARLMCEK